MTKVLKIANNNYMIKKDKVFFVTFCFLFVLLISAFALKISAATEATITATVTAQNISVTVDDGAVTYGTLGVGTSTNTTSGLLNDSQTIVNEGNVTEDFDIRGSNSANWTLAGTPDANAYTHEFCTTDCDSSPSWLPLTTSNQTIYTSKGVGTSSAFDLQLRTPSSTTNYDQQSVNVTVVATAS